MTVYISLILIILLFDICPSKLKKLLFVVSGIILFLVSAIRYDVGTDYLHYGNIFYRISSGQSDYVETGYKYLNLFVSRIFNKNVLGIYVTTSLIIIFYFMKSIKQNIEKKYWFFGVFLFICSGIYFSSFNLIRQYIAISLLAYGTNLLIKKKYIFYLFLVLFCSTFHTSALICIIFLIIIIYLRNQQSSRILWIIYFLGIIFLFVDIRFIFNLFQSVIPERWLWYLNSDFLNNKNRIAILKQIIPNILMAFILYKRSVILKINPKVDIYIIGYLCCLFLTNCFSGVLLLLRLANYFDIYLVFLLPFVIEVWNKKCNRLIVKYILILYYLILTIVTIFIMGGYGAMPYQTIFNY